MAPEDVNPAVEDAEGAELDGLNAELERLAYRGDGGELDAAEAEEATPEQEAEPEADEAQPTAETPEEATGRRSRRDGKDKPKVNLDDFPEFRQYKAERDRQYETERRARIELERRQDEIARQAQEAQLANLQRQFEATDPDDAEARWKLVDQIASVRAQEQVRKMQAEQGQARQWAEYVEAQVKEAGVDPKDFPPEKYHNRPAGMFERDLSMAILKEAKKLREAASPQAIERKAKSVAAKTLNEAGLDVADAAAPGKGVTDEDSRYERDARLLQLGKLSSHEFLKRWGDK